MSYLLERFAKKQKNNIFDMHTPVCYNSPTHEYSSIFFVQHKCTGNICLTFLICMPAQSVDDSEWCA